MISRSLPIRIFRRPRAAVNHALFWNASTRRALAEGWLAATLMTLAMLTTLRDAPPLVISMFYVLIAAICCLWAGLRARQTELHPWKLLLRREALAALAISLGLLLVVSLLLTVFGLSSLFERSHVGKLASFCLLALSAPGYLATRAGSYFWRFWDQLRRRRYVWGLTHTILCVIGTLGMLVVLGCVIYTSQINQVDFSAFPAYSLFGRMVVWIFTLFLFLLATTLAGLVLFSLPAFAFAYGVARKITSRLDSLTRVTNAMRGGDFSARVPVEGEDEIAALQASFNTLAANLDRSTHALRAERDKVTDLLRVQRELTAGVSHELRTPAATILAYTEMLQAGWQNRPPEEVARDLEIVAHEAGRLQAILNDMLTLAQSEASRLSLNVQPLSLDGPVQRCVNTLAPLAWETKRVRVSAELAKDLPGVRADEKRIEQILINLIQNGIRHTPPGGAVVAACGSDTQNAWLEVADTGEGIPPEDLNAIWEKFYRGSASEQQDGLGMGLGLALVKELAEAMGGSVSVESVWGEGSVFRVSFPL